MATGEGPRLVTTYFGRRGSFAFDAKGEYVVLQGYGWGWKGYDDDQDNPEVAPFERSPLPWAYLALLNSDVFEVFTEYFCPRVRGGQFNLSDRFIARAFLPDLSDETYQMDDTVTALAEIGRKIHDGHPISSTKLRQASSRISY